MNKLISSFLLIFVLFASSAFAGKGKVRGKVIEDSNGLPIIGANVIIKGTSTGTITDLDGNFTLNLDEGTYAIQISFITFQTVVIENVQVKTDEVTLLEIISLKGETTQLEEFVVEATAVRTTEEALLKMKSKSPAMIDGVSSSTFKLTGDGSAAEAVKRVTGVSVEGGKYVFVRGLGDRYTKTTLNGVDIPGLDPDRNSLQMDIFPTSLIDNMVVTKNFTADLPADFTGGLVNIETKAFPDDKFVNASLNIGVNPSMHFNPNYLSYEGSNTDFLGFDNGARALPTQARYSTMPTPFSGKSKEEVNNFIKSFNPTLGATQGTSFMDYGLSVSAGNQISLGKKATENGMYNAPKLGFIFSLSYKNETRFYDDVVYGEYQKFIDPELLNMRYATIQEGELGENNVLIGAMGGLAFKTKNHKIKLTAMRLQNGESRAGQFNIDNDGAAVGQSGYIAFSNNLEYNQRALTNVLLNGQHVLKNPKWEIDWKISPTLSTSEDPDIRKTAFTFRPNDTLFMAGAGGNPSRIWRDLNEINATAKIDVTKKFKFNGVDGNIMFGARQVYKSRDYEILFYDIQFFGNQNWASLDPNKILDESNLYPNQPNSVYYQSGNNNPNPNQYSSTVNSSAAYVSTDITLFPNFRSIVGVRAEQYVQTHTGRDQRYASGDTENGRSLNDEEVLNSLDFFPSVNLIYSLKKQQNLRFSYSKSIARPSFKELSFAQIIDPITNRIFNGSLFTYTDWDGKLVETRIDNIDLRWEYISDKGETVSLSTFYKNFVNPIELVRIPEQQTSTEYQPRNVGNGMLYGIEIDLRKNLGFLTPTLENFTVVGNFTWVESRIDMTAVEFNARKNYEKEGELIRTTRQMAGQSPYVINSGLSYRNIGLGLNAGLFYNVNGPTLMIVGSGLFPDIYVDPFHSLNFTLSKKFGDQQKLAADLKITNILNDNIDQVYRAYNTEDQPFTQYSPRTAVSIGVNYSF